ncbi:hypothetical protein [Nisaea nitritireducens]|uniref:hypothetical protein n=1 Tax=Nisaea nitritireducens TaxID=568392 RepID=UPI0018685E7E|nr:hypothetical protein [Nisaea nitritireducens]
MDIKSTIASQNIARTQTQSVQRNTGSQAPGQPQGTGGAVSVSVPGESQKTSELGENVNDNLSSEDALALAGNIAEQLANLPSDTGIVSNPALLEEAARGVS